MIPISTPRATAAATGLTNREDAADREQDSKKGNQPQPRAPAVFKSNEIIILDTPEKMSHMPKITGELTTSIW